MKLTEEQRLDIKTNIINVVNETYHTSKSKHQRALKQGTGKTITMYA